MLTAQLSLVRDDSVAVSRDGVRWENAWGGGFNSPQFSEMDLDGDGIRDLVAFERDFYGCVKTYLYHPGEGYRYAPAYQAHFPHMRNWMLLRDYDCDGKEDIFTSVPAGVAVYRNDSGPGPGLTFTLVTPLLQTFGLDGAVPLFVSPPDIPAIVDVDGDGDLDILTFNVIGSTMEYHKNLSMENSGGCNELEFELRNACWGYFSEDGNNNTLRLFDTCEVNVNDPEKASRHAGSTTLAIDLDGNGTRDLLIGDITYDNLVMLMNGGTPTNASMVSQSIDFPSNSVAVDLTTFPAAYAIDVDHDGLEDLLVSPNNPKTSINYRNSWYYRNEGTGSLPVFVYQQDDFLQEGMIDLGERSYPAFVDVDNDGLADILAGSYGYYENAGEYSSRLIYLENTGSSESPAFEIITDDYAGLAEYGFDGIYPAFADMDDDGDPDMITGDEQGNLHFFENQAAAGEAADFVLTQPNYMGIDAGQSAKPQLVDVDKDGLTDLLVGERGGTLLFYRNQGTPQAAAFDSEPTLAPFGAIDVMPECCTGFAAPFMTSDSLGNSVLYVGSEQGWLYRYSNIDGNLDGVFNLDDSLYLHGVNITINGFDINGDGRQEYVYGEFAGGLGLLKQGFPSNLGTEEVTHMQDKAIRPYPNPVSDKLYLNIPTDYLGHQYSVTVMDILGNKLFEKTFSGTFLRNGISLDFLIPGFYVLQLNDNSRVQAMKFIKQ